MIDYRAFETANPAHHAHAAALWTRACGAALTLSPRALAYNTRPWRNGQQAGQFAFAGDEPAGFVLASYWKGNDLGWVDALAVAPEFRQRGLGQHLLEWAEAWLRAQGCGRAQLGASLRWFVPGVPVELNDAFFRTRGYLPSPNALEEWDLALDLHEYVSPAFLRALNVGLGPAASHDVEPLRDFLRREFPARWLIEFEQHLADGGATEEYILLTGERGVEACCRVTFEDSVRCAERFYPTPLPRPWGQAGSIGVSADRRKVGYGSALLDAALKYLQARGVRGCVIDWTDLASYYERFGFKRHRAYRMLSKSLDRVHHA